MHLLILQHPSNTFIIMLTFIPNSINYNMLSTQINLYFEPLQLQSYHHYYGQFFQTFKHMILLAKSHATINHGNVKGAFNLSILPVFRADEFSIKPQASLSPSISFNFSFTTIPFQLRNVRMFLISQKCLLVCYEFSIVDHKDTAFSQWTRSCHSNAILSPHTQNFSLFN